MTASLLSYKQDKQEVRRYTRERPEKHLGKCLGTEHGSGYKPKTWGGESGEQFATLVWHTRSPRQSQLSSVRLGQSGCKRLDEIAKSDCFQIGTIVIFEHYFIGDGLDADYCPFRCRESGLVFWL
jgi:hypothetical protein